MLERASPPLGQTTCWLLADTEEVMGELSLTEQVLVFEPEPGAEEHGLRLPLSRILGATVTPIKERLMVQTLSHTRWFAGPGVPTLGRRLELLLHQPTPQAEAAEVPALASDEPLLVSGAAWWGLLRGELWLTDRRVRFTLQGPWAWLARLVGRAAWLEIPRSEARLLPGDAVELGGLGVRVAGTAAQQAAIQLAQQAALLLAWPAGWRDGGRWGRGLVTLDAGQLCLHTLRGSRGRCIPLEAIHRLEIRWGRLRVHLLDGGSAVQISLASPRLLLRRLLYAILQARDVPRAGLTEERMRLTMRAVRWHDDGSAELGLLELAGRRLIFQPAAPQAPALEYRLSELRRVPSPAHAIRLEHAGQVLRFEPAGGGDAVEQFWRTHDIPERVQPWPHEVADQRRLLSDPRCVTLTTPDGQEIILRPGMLITQPDGFGILMPDTAEVIPEGTLVGIEIGRSDGIYQLEARMTGTTAPPEQRFLRTGKVFTFAPPDEVRFFNQRSAFRVALQMAVSAWKLRLDVRRNTWIPDGDRITGQLIDLSISGCALHTRAEVGTGEHLFLEMLIDDHWLPLEVECMRVEPGWPEGFNLGLRFLNLPERLEQLLSRTVLAQQRANERSG